MRGLRALDTVALWVGRTTMLFLVALFLLLGARAAYRASVHGTGRGTGAVKPGDDVQPGDPRLLKVYPGKDLGEIEEIRQSIRDSAPANPNAPPRGAFASRHVNIGPDGFRVTPGREVDGARTVFLFGGSTTWGYNLPDDETIASHLQRRLDEKGAGRWRVMNRGVCASYSKFERQLFESLLAKGARPAAVVFIDGLNEFCRIPLNRPREDLPQPGANADAAQGDNPILAWFRAPPATAQRRPKKEEVRPYTAEDIRRAAMEMVMNWRMLHAVCDRFGIPCLPVLQPIPIYEYSLDEHLFLTEEQLHSDRSYYLAARTGYEMLAGGRKLADVPHLDLHGLTVDGPEYVDTCHYSSAFSDRLAAEIATWLAGTSNGVPAR